MVYLQIYYDFATRRDNPPDPKQDPKRFEAGTRAAHKAGKRMPLFLGSRSFSGLMGRKLRIEASLPRP